MLSEADPNSSVEPWFALSKDRYWSILNEALSEMEPRDEPEAGGLVLQAELPNCTELIKLLNQDDGLSSAATGATALLVPPGVRRSAASGVRPAPNRPCDAKANRVCAQQVRSLGSQSFPGGAKRKRTTSCKGNSFGSLCKSLRKGSDGVQPRGCANGRISDGSIESSATATQLRRTVAVGRGKDSIKEHEEALRRRRRSNFESRDATSAAAPPSTDCDYSLRFPEAFSLRFHDIGRRPSSDDRYFQGHHSSAGGTAVAIPSRDLSRSRIVPTVKAKEDRWPRSGSLPCALSGVKVEPKDEFSTISGKTKKTLDQSILRPPSCNFDGRNNIPPTTTTTTATSAGRSDRNESSAAEVTSRQPPTSGGGGGGVGVDFAVGVVAPFVELLKSDQSAVSRRTPGRTDPETRDTTGTAAPPPPPPPPIRVIPCRIRVAVEDHFKHSPPAAPYSSRLNGRSLLSGTRYSSSDDTDDDRRGVVLVAPPPDGENTLRRDAEGGASSPSDFRRGTSEQQQHRQDKGARSSKRGIPSFRRERELWAAFDKSVVNSMMQQILDEEDAIRQRLKQTHLNGNEEEREQEQEEEVEVEVKDHLCPNGQAAEVDPVKRTKFPPGDTSSAPCRKANVPDHGIAFVEPNTENVVHRGVNEISNSPASSQEFARDLRIKSKSLSANRNSDIAGSSSSSNSSSSSSSSSSRHMPDTTATRMPALSPLIGETGTGEKFQSGGDAIAFNAQKLGMSRMSFKWKSKMLNRLRKDQITANKWCMSETLSV